MWLSAAISDSIDLEIQKTSNTHSPFWRGSLPSMGAGKHVSSQLCTSTLELSKHDRVPE